MKNLFALSLVFSLSFAPLAIAQEVPAVDASAVPAETAPVTEAAPVPEPVSDSQGGDASLAVPVVADENPAPLPEVQPEVLVQDTTNTQDTVTADVLQGTEDPVELATSTIAIEPLATMRFSVPSSSRAEVRYQLRQFVFSVLNPSCRSASALSFRASLSAASRRRTWVSSSAAH